MIAFRDPPEERDELQRRHTLNEADVELAIVYHRIGSNEPAAAHEPGVADGERVQVHRLITIRRVQARVDRLEVEQHLCAADQVGELASHGFQARVDRVGDLGQKTTRGDVHETAIVHAADVDA